MQPSQRSVTDGGWLLRVGAANRKQAICDLSHQLLESHLRGVPIRACVGKDIVVATLERVVRPVEACVEFEVSSAARSDRSRPWDSNEKR
jgi:hypothetical protein